jgi:hypothetical protein
MKNWLVLLSCLLVGSLLASGVFAAPTSYGEVDESVLTRLATAENKIDAILVRLEKLESQIVTSSGSQQPATPYSNPVASTATVGNASTGSLAVTPTYTVASYSQPVGSVFVASGGSAGNVVAAPIQPVRTVARVAIRTATAPVRFVRSGILGLRRTAVSSPAMYCDENGCYSN